MEDQGVVLKNGRGLDHDAVQSLLGEFLAQLKLDLVRLEGSHGLEGDDVALGRELNRGRLRLGSRA